MKKTLNHSTYCGKQLRVCSPGTVIQITQSFQKKHVRFIHRMPCVFVYIVSITVAWVGTLHQYIIPLYRVGLPAHLYKSRIYCGLELDVCACFALFCVSYIMVDWGCLHLHSFPHAVLVSSTMCASILIQTALMQ